MVEEFNRAASDPGEFQAPKHESDFLVASRCDGGSCRAIVADVPNAWREFRGRAAPALA